MAVWMAAATPVGRRSRSGNGARAATGRSRTVEMACCKPERCCACPPPTPARSPPTPMGVRELRAVASGESGVLDSSGGGPGGGGGGGGPNEWGAGTERS